MSNAFGLNDTADYYLTAERMYASAVAGNLTRLDVSSCIRAYSATFQTTRGSLILVTQNPSFSRVSNSFENNQDCSRDPVGWICNTQHCDEGYGVPCSVSQVDVSNWNPFGSKVDYCLSEVLVQRCKVQLTPNLAYVVCTFNLFKTAILIYTFFFVLENPLMTMGDAVASFLEKKDYTTKGYCLMGKNEVREWTSIPAHLLDKPKPKMLNSKPKRWGSVISKRRWIVFITL
jgi:hypothetical protein